MAGMILSQPAASVSVKTPSSIPATALLNATQHERAMLVDVYELLDRLFVRNRNQHRRSHWWKSLHQFRKHLGLLLQEMEVTKKTERTAKIEARLRFWDENCIHQWYYQFSQLVSVGPFAVLGLVLMASVARLCRISGITTAYEEIASGDIQGVLSANDDLLLASEFGGVMGGGDEWDEGVVIARD